MGKRVAVAVTNDLCGRVASGEAILAAGIAPGAIRVPVPCLQVGFGVLSIRFGQPSRAEHLLDCRGGEKLVAGRSAGMRSMLAPSAWLEMNLLVQ